MELGNGMWINKRFILLNNNPIKRMIMNMCWALDNLLEIEGVHYCNTSFNLWLRWTIMPDVKVPQNNTSSRQKIYL